MIRDALTRYVKRSPRVFRGEVPNEDGSTSEMTVLIEGEVTDFRMDGFTEVDPQNQH